MIPARTCRQCGRSFVPAKPNRWFCSWECYTAWHSEPHNDESELEEHTFGLSAGCVLTAGELARMRAGDFRELD